MTLGTGSRHPGDPGFTLIEVLVATVILFAGLAAVLGAYSSAVSALDQATEVLAATQIIREKAAEVELAAGPARRGLTSSAGILEQVPFRYDWSVICRRVVTAADVEIIEAEIDARRAGQSGRHTLVTHWAQVSQPGEAGTAR